MNVSGWVHCESSLWRVWFAHECNSQFIKRTTKDHQCVFFSHPALKANVSASRAPQIWCHLSVELSCSGMVACAGSPGAEADVEGFTHFKALGRQPQDERWRKKEGLGLNPATPPPLLLSPPFHSPLSLALLPLLTSQLGLCRATEPVVVQGVRPESQCCKTCHSHFLNAFDQTLPKANVRRQSSSVAAKVIWQTYIYQILLL